MSIGGAGNTVSFGIKAIADLKGITDVSNSLKGLSSEGTHAGQGIATGMASAEKGLTGVQSRAQLVSQSLKGIAEASVGALAVGEALFKIGESYEKALDTIRTGTGATGKQLEELGNDARAVFREVPTDLQTAASAISELTQRTGDTGKALQDLAANEIELSHITGTDLNTNIENSSKLFAQWNVTVEEQVPTLDKLLRASQATGIGVDKLGGELVQFGPILQTMGFNLDQSIAFLAALDKAGVDTASVMTGLRVAIKKFADEGVTDVAGQLKIIFDQIKNAPTDLAAATIAIDTFGARAGPQLANNIRSGRLSYDDLLTTVSTGTETITKAAQETQHFGDKMTLLKNNVEDALIPLGIQLLDALNAMVPAMQKGAQFIGEMSAAFEKLPGPIRDFIGFGVLIIGAIAGIAVAVETVSSVVGKATGALDGLADAMTGIVGAGAEAAGGIADVGAAAAAATPEVEGLAVAEDGAAVSAEGMGAASAASAGGIGLASGALAGLATNLGLVVAGFAAYKLGSDELNAAQNGGQPGWAKYANDIAGSFGRIVAEGLKISGQGSLANELNQYIDDSFASVSVQDKAIKLGFTIDTSTGVQGGIIKEIGISADEAQKEADAAGLTIDQYLQNYAKVLGLKQADTKATQEQTEAQKLANEAAASGLTVDQQKIQDAIDKKKVQDDFNTSLQETLNAQFIAGGQFQDWMLPFIRGAKDAQAEAEKLKQGLDDSTTSALNTIKGIQDIAPGIDGMQAGFGKVGESITDILRHMDDLGVVNFSPAVRQALDAVSTLDAVQKKIDGVDASIKQNQGDMSMWQGRITLVTDAFGANSQQIGEWQKELENGTITQDQFNAAVASLGSSGGFPRLDALLAQGKISRDEYNKAVDAGTWLIQRSAGGLQDEDAQIVQNIIDLANYAKAHDTADASIKKLSSSQREFLAAMDSTQVTAFLQQIQLLKSIGASPDYITKFIVDASQADPVIKGIAQDLGLIPPDKHTTVVVDAKTEDAQAKVKAVDEQKIKDKVFQVAAETGKAVAGLQDVAGVSTDVVSNGKTVRIEVTADTKEAAEQFLALNRDAISKLDGRKLVVYVKGDDGQYQLVKDHVINDKLPDKTSTIDVKTIDAIGKLKAVQGVIADVTADGKTVTISANTNQAAQEFLRLNRDSLGKLHDKTVVVKVLGDDGQWRTVAEDVIKTNIPPKRIDIQTIDAVGKLKAVEGAIVDVTANGKVITVSADTQDAANKFLDLNKNEIAKLDGRELVVRVKGDDGKWQTVKDHIIKETIPDKTVTVKIAAALPAATGAGIPLTGGNLLGNLKDVSISITAEDKTKPGTDAAKTSLDTFSTNAATQGNTAGQNWGDGVSSGMGASSGAIASGVAAVAQTLDFSSAAFNYGFNDGWNFGIGEANGIAATWNDVFNAAFNVGYAAYVGNQAGMQAHSPSKLALAAGKNWGDSIADGIRSAAGNVHAAANALAGGLPTQFASPATQLAMRSALTSDSRTQAVLAGSSGRGSTTIHHVQTINQTLNFHGITDTTAIVNEVHTQTYRALDRGQAAGLFGS